MFPRLGHGLGLRPPHYEEVTTGSPHVDWWEVISENFMIGGGKPLAVLRAVRERWPVVLHGVSLSIGSVDSLDLEYLARLAELVDHIEPAIVSDHLCWSRFGGHASHDLWPVPYTEEALDHVVSRVAQVQERLGRRILLENPSSYVTFAASEIGEPEFLAEVANRADCGILLDVNNIYVSCSNHGWDAEHYLATIPRDRVGQIHLAGHSDRGTHLLDTHDHPVCEAVWQLYRRAAERFGEVATMIERDDNIPALTELVEELARARRIAAAVQADATTEWVEVRHGKYSPPQVRDHPGRRSIADRIVVSRRATASSAPPSASRSARLGDQGGHQLTGNCTKLADIQRQFYDEVTAGTEACESTRDSGLLGASQSLEVYSRMYFGRLHDALADDFPKVRSALGAEGFRDLATAYIRARPPTSFTIRDCSASLSEYLATRGDLPPWCSDLAALERAFVDVFHGADALALSRADVTAVPAERFPDMQIRWIPACAVVAVGWTVDDLWSAVDVDPTARFAPEPCTRSVVVWRRDLRILHRTLDADEAELARLLTQPTTLAAVSATLAELVGDSPERRMVELLARWLDAEMLAAGP